MSVQTEKQPAERRKRVQMLKRLILVTLTLSIVTPIVLCVLLMSRVNKLEREIERLSNAVVAMSGVQKRVDMEENGSKNTLETETPKTDKTSEDISENIAEDISENFAEDKTTDTTDLQQNGDADVSVMDEDIQAETESVENTVESTTHEKTATRKVYLTFDDGPSSNTIEILDILAEYGVKATFFVNGRTGKTAETAYRRIVEEGHTLAMHSYTHNYGVVYESVESFADDFQKLQEYLFEMTGVRCTYIRFPGGSSNEVSTVDMKEFIRYADEQGWIYYDWNVSADDAIGMELTAEDILEKCMTGINKYAEATVLMHDLGSKNATVEALRLLIEEVLAMENTELLPITEETIPVQHITITK